MTSSPESWKPLSLEMLASDVDPHNMRRPANPDGRLGQKMNEPKLITEWTPELKLIAAEVVLRLLQHSPKGDHFELMDELVEAVARKRPLQVDTEYLSFSTSCWIHYKVEADYEPIWTQAK